MREYNYPAHYHGYILTIKNSPFGGPCFFFGNMMVWLNFDLHNLCLYTSFSISGWMLLQKISIFFCKNWAPPIVALLYRRHYDFNDLESTLRMLPHKFCFSARSGLWKRFLTGFPTEKSGCWNDENGGRAAKYAYRILHFTWYGRQCLSIQGWHRLWIQFTHWQLFTCLYIFLCKKKVPLLWPYLIHWVMIWRKKLKSTIPEDALT